MPRGDFDDLLDGEIVGGVAANARQKACLDAHERSCRRIEELNDSREAWVSYSQ